MFAPIKYAIRVKTPLISPIPINSIIEANDDCLWIRIKREISENKEPTPPKKLLIPVIWNVTNPTTNHPNIQTKSIYTFQSPPQPFFLFLPIVFLPSLLFREIVE